MRGRKHVPPLHPRQACALFSPANLRANLKSISPPARPETWGTYVSTNYSVELLVSCSITSEFSATGGNQLSTRGSFSRRLVSLTLDYWLRLQRSHFLVSSVNSPCYASLGCRSDCSHLNLKFYPVITLIRALGFIWSTFILRNLAFI